MNVVISIIKRNVISLENINLFFTEKFANFSMGMSSLVILPRLQAQGMQRDISGVWACIPGRKARHTVDHCICSDRDRLGFYTVSMQGLGLFCDSAFLLFKRVNTHSRT